MRTPKLARPVAATFFVGSALLLAACAGETTSPSTTPLTALGATKSLVGVKDGVYAFTINPNKDNSIALGDSRLYLPAESICRLSTTKYGPAYWNSDCDEESRLVTITAVVTDAESNSPRIEFTPALRFKPDRSVRLSLHVSDAETLNNMTTVLYCGPFEATCVDESLTDTSLATTVNVSEGLVSRRIKHFSGYVVAERALLR